MNTFDMLTETRFGTSSKSQVLIGVLGLIVAVAATARTAQAQTTSFRYQGRLTETGAAANGVYDLEFKLFDAVGAQSGPTVRRDDVQVTDGLFSVPLDFGLSPFTTGTAFTLEIGVRPGDSTADFTAMTPRQPLTSSPYAIQTINSTQLGGVPAGQYVKTDDLRLIDSRPPLPGSVSYIQNTTTQQASASFNIAGNGLIAGSVGIGTTPNTDVKLQVKGNTQLIIKDVGTIRNQINFGTPNAETGMSILTTDSGSGRADLRYDGRTLKLLATGFGIPPAKNGIIINNNGVVGVGWDNPLDPELIYTGSRLNVSNTTPGGGGLNVKGSSTGIYADGGSFGIQAFSYNTALTANSPNGFAARFYGQVYFDKVVSGGRTPLCTDSYGVLANCNSSSLRYKTDLHPFTGGLNIINRLRPISYRWKEDGVPDLGFGAEDVAKVEPLFTFRNQKGDIEGVRYDRLSVVFVNAIKEQQAQIERQRKQIEELKQLVCRTRSVASACKRHG